MDLQINVSWKKEVFLYFGNFYSSAHRQKWKGNHCFSSCNVQALPREHAAHYKARWPIEKCFRTCKQMLGLQECFSRSLDKQHDLAASVFLSYALAQLHRKTYKLKTSEEAIRRCKTKNVNSLTARFSRILYEKVHACA